MMQLRLRLSVALFCLLLCDNAHADTAQPPTRAPSSLNIALQTALENEAKGRGHPSLAMAVFDASGVVWSSTTGFSDAEAKVPATLATIYRAGSITKLFTDILLIQLVEEGRIDLDSPVTQYLPDFKPENPYKTKITVRHLLTHTSGLVREPPVGSYFELGDPGSSAIVASLNKTRLVAEPGTVRKYSNAGFAVAGRIVEVVANLDLDTLMSEKLIQPAGMTSSQLTTTNIKGRIAHAEFAPFGSPRKAAPVFDIGLKAAGGLNTTVGDLSAFGSALLRGGVGSRGQLLKSSTLETMYQVRPVSGGSARDIGLGFTSKKLGNERMLGHSGGIYGFTSEFWLLPDRGIGVVVFGTVDGDAAPDRLAHYGLEATLAQKIGSTPPTFLSQTIAPSKAMQSQLEGHFVHNGTSVDIRSIDGRLLVETPTAIGELSLRDGVLTLFSDFGIAGKANVDPDGQWIELSTKRFVRAAVKPPVERGAAIRSLFGDYGWDHERIRVYERDGQPYVNIEWFDHSRMTKISDDVWAFPDNALLYARERLVFKRDKAGRGVSISLNGIIFNRLPDKLPIVDDAQRESARQKIAKLTKIALAASPPVEATSDKVAPDLVSIRSIDPTIKRDIRYAGNNNFLGVPVYNAPVAMLQRPAAEALGRAHRRLKKMGYGLLVHDGYRPWYVTKIFWDATPDEDKLFVADPAEGSRHNRGGAVDLSLYDLKTGKPVQMPGLYDETSERSYPNFVGGSSRERWHRDLLKQAMEAEGFSVYGYEWWHFDYEDWRRYPIQNRFLSENPSN
jgi:CubicO group peptidase (beta-lactamase class C family)/D-alanyl-D-alanine dipeptidase